MNERPFTVKQLAERWSCSYSYIYKLIAEEKLKAFHLGGTLKRITHQEVEQWESGQKNQPSSPTASDNTDSDGSSINSLPSGTKTASGAAIDLASQRKQKRERSFMRLRERT